MELVCPAGNLPALKLAVDHGADAVYMGFKDQTNARHFPGLNLDGHSMGEGIAYARRHGVRIFLALNTYAQAGQQQRWFDAVERAADMGVDALIAADIGVLDYAARHHPQLPLHLSVQGSATNRDALRFYQEQFGVRRAVLPRVLTLAQIEALAEDTPVELEVFGFGSLCIMVEGRCFLSSYLTGRSPNTHGACSPAEYVRWEEKGDQLESRLNGKLVDRFAPGEPAGYPTLCKGRFEAGGRTYHAFEEPTSLNTLALLPKLKELGISAVKLEGRQRSPSYVRDVTRTWRQALDAVERQPDAYQVQSDWQKVLTRLSEGSQTTFGAYERAWH